MKHFIKQIKQVERVMLASYPSMYEQMNHFRFHAITTRKLSWNLGYMPRVVTEVAAICESYVQSTPNPLRFPPENWWETFSASTLCSHLTSCSHTLRSWAFTKRIYNLDSTLSELLINTSIPDNTPASIFTKLPEWGMCVKTNTDRMQNALLQDIQGFIVSIQEDPTGGSTDEFYGSQGLEFLILFGGHRSQTTFVHFLPDETVADIIKRLHEGVARANEYENTENLFPEDEIRQNTDTLARAILSITLYLCSADPEYKGGIPGGKPKIGIKGKFEFPKNPRVIQVGSVLGTKLKAQSAQNSGASKKPHMRKAHWHGVWTGPKNDPLNPQKFKLNWIPPLFVNCDAP